MSSKKPDPFEIRALLINLLAKQEGVKVSYEIEINGCVKKYST